MMKLSIQGYESEKIGNGFVYNRKLDNLSYEQWGNALNNTENNSNWKNVHHSPLEYVFENGRKIIQFIAEN